MMRLREKKKENYNHEMIKFNHYDRNFAPFFHRYLSSRKDYLYSSFLVSSLCNLQGRSLSYKTFFIWVLISIYQGKLNRMG